MEPDVMVYLMTGFLDSGKTQFLKFTWVLLEVLLQINGRNFSTVNRCQRRYSLQKDKNVSPDVQRTPKEMTILSRTALELL